MAPRLTIQRRRQPGYPRSRTHIVNTDAAPTREIARTRHFRSREFPASGWHTLGQLRNIHSPDFFTGEQSAAMMNPGCTGSVGPITTLALCIPATMALNAQPAVSFEDRTNSGVALLIPGSTDFLEALSSHVDSDGRDALRPIEPYLAIVRNDTGRPLVAAVVRYERLNRTGQIFYANSIWLTTQNQERRKAQPGEKILIGPFGGFSRLLRDRLRLQDPAVASSDVARRAAEFAEEAAVRITLDSVVFDDGTLLGPDKAGLEWKLREYLRAERELRAEILRLPHASRRQHLIGIVEDAEFAVELELQPADAHGAHRAGTARVLLNLLENAPSEAQFVVWLNQVIGSPLPDPRREM